MQDFQQGNNQQSSYQPTANSQQPANGASQQQRPYQPQQKRPYRPQQPPKKNKGLKMACIIIPIVLLFFALIAGVAIFFGYKYFSENSPGIDIESLINSESSESGFTTTYSTYEALNELSDLDLSLSEIQDIERNCLNDGDSEEEEALKARIIALKHIYTEAFLTEEHSLQTLKNIYMLHAGEFSEDQRDVLKGFFSLSIKEQQLWELVEGKVENFEDFVSKMDDMVTQAAYDEY